MKGRESCDQTCSQSQSSREDVKLNIGRGNDDDISRSVSEVAASHGTNPKTDTIVEQVIDSFQTWAYTKRCH